VARKSLTVLVLAAGKGQRVRSKTIKLLHPVAGQPMVAHVLDVARALKPRRLISVIGHQAEAVRAALTPGCSSFVLQKQQRGTGHAVLQAAREIAGARSSTLLILNGDLPTLRSSTLRMLLRRHEQSKAALSLLTAEIDDPTGYGRIVRDACGRIVRIVEHRDASASEKKIAEINVGIYCASPTTMLNALRRLRPNNAQGEYYITDAVRYLLDRGEKVVAPCHGDAEEVLGVNTRQELARAGATLYSRKADAVQDRGVTLLDARRTWIDPRARIGRDTTIYPDVIIEGATVLGEDCTVYPGCRLVDARIGRGVQIKDHSVVLDSKLGNDVQVGPFAHLRPGSTLEPGARVGNFVELKKSTLGRGSKAGHLSYIGDATIGPDCNIGAGTITCNYDGTHKHPTRLGRGVFIGSDTQLVAPVNLADGAYVAAGSTVTRDVPAGALAIGRGRQRNIDGWVKKQKKKQAGKARKRG
jgi:bifunctional UDP-N-acetylglucosamine pyrophosphorylase/glucosamine-1-phosphate N-acetyltransferase